MQVLAGVWRRRASGKPSSGDLQATCHDHIAKHNTSHITTRSGWCHGGCSPVRSWATTRLPVAGACLWPCSASGWCGRQDAAARAADAPLDGATCHPSPYYGLAVPLSKPSGVGTVWAHPNEPGARFSTVATSLLCSVCSLLPSCTGNMVSHTQHWAWETPPRCVSEGWQVVRFPPWGHRSGG